MPKMTLRSAIKAINELGITLVFPINNQKEPTSLWYHFFPRTPMRWEWDSSGDNRVAELWHLREELSRSQKVVYSKWFRGRATFFSRDVFTAALSTVRQLRGEDFSLGREATNLLGHLEESSPQSTKMLKRNAGLQGKLLSKIFDKSLKELWEALVIVGFGEVDDGAFPSLNMGATKHLFEDLWIESFKEPREKERSFQNLLMKFPPWERFFYQRYLRTGKGSGGSPGGNKILGATNKLR